MGSTLLVIIQVSVLLDPLHHHVDQPVLQGLTTFTSPSSPPARLLESDRPEELVVQQTISLSLSLWILHWSASTWRAPLLPQRLLLQLQEVPCSGSPSRVGKMLNCSQRRFKTWCSSNYNCSHPLRTGRRQAIVDVGAPSKSTTTAQEASHLNQFMHIARLVT